VPTATQPAAYVLTRRDRADRAGFIASLAHPGRRYAVGGWQPFCLAFAGVAIERIEAAITTLQPEGRGDGPNTYEPARVLAYARRVGVASPARLLALIEATGDASDRPAVVCATLAAALAA
jgi:hypothetical protein